MEEYSMTLKSPKGTYLIKPNLRHKEEVDIGLDQPILIAKEYENHLIHRNPQTGIVMSVPEDNPLELIVGDTVYVSHMTFYGEIAEHTKDFQLQPHVKHNGGLLFPCSPKNIYYRLDGEDIEPLGDILLMTPIEEEEKEGDIFLGEVKRKDRAIVAEMTDDYMKGDVLLVESNALYPIEINKTKYFRLRKGEVTGRLVGDKIIPNDDRIVVRDLIQEKESVLDLSFMRVVEDVQAEVLAVGNNVTEFKAGDIVLRRKSGGKKFGDVVVITMQGILDEESVYGKILNKAC